jgi:antibiotic biosynthesis monooxygenase (ABM) superfamily enzyme
VTATHGRPVGGQRRTSLLVSDDGAVDGERGAELAAGAQGPVTTAVTVALMTWVVMPRVTRLLHRWLYP